MYLSTTNPSSGSLSRRMSGFPGTGFQLVSTQHYQLPCHHGIPCLQGDDISDRIGEKSKVTFFFRNILHPNKQNSYIQAVGDTASGGDMQGGAHFGLPTLK